MADLQKKIPVSWEENPGASEETTVQLKKQPYVRAKYPIVQMKRPAVTRTGKPKKRSKKKNDDTEQKVESTGDTRALHVAYHGKGRAKAPHEKYKYRTRHRMLKDGFCVFTLESDRFTDGSYSRHLASKFQREFFKQREEKVWPSYSESLTQEDDRKQVESSVFAELIRDSRPLMQWVKSVPHLISTALYDSQDSYITFLQNFPSVLINTGTSTIQRLHTDWETHMENRCSVIMAITEIELILSTAGHSKWINQNLPLTLEKLDLKSLTLEPGEIICFDGNLIHAGGRNKKGAMRVFWYGSYNLQVARVPFDSVTFAEVEIDPHADLDKIEKLQ